MRVKILGSGGCVALPLPCCACEVCSEARQRGVPYSRSGCSVFIEDINTLIDTPEDIAQSLNREAVQKVENILYSHWDPDHTLGMRVIENLKLNWFDYHKGIEPEEKITVIGLGEVIKDIKAIKNKFGSYLEYYESMNLIKTIEKNIGEAFYIDNIKVTIVAVDADGVASVFILEDGEKKLVYAPCDVKPFPVKEKAIYGADALIIGNTIPDEPLKNGEVLGDTHEIKNILFTMEEIVEIKNEYNINEVIITHLEEDWGKSYDDYLLLEEKYKSDNIKFAYDGMTIKL